MEMPSSRLRYICYLEKRPLLNRRGPLPYAPRRPWRPPAPKAQALVPTGGVRCAIVVDHEDPVARVRPGLGGLCGHRKRPRSSAKSEPGGWQRGHDVPVQACAEFFGSGALDRRGNPERRPAAPKPAAVARHRRAADLRPAASTDARQLLGQLARGERRRARDVRYVAFHAGPRARARAAGTALTTQFGARPWDRWRRLAMLPAKS